MEVSKLPVSERLRWEVRHPVNRCESCSNKLGALSLRFIRGEVTRQEWTKRAFQGVQGHHPDWTLTKAWEYARSRAPFYPFGDPAQHRYPGEKVSP